MRKHYLALAVSAVMLAAACEKHVAVEAPQPEQAVLNVSLQGSITKVTDTSGEDAVENVQVFVFRKDGSLDAYGTSAGSVVSMSCTVGERDIVAIVNAPQYAGIKDYGTLSALLSDLKDNAPGRFVMSGTTACNVSVSTSVEVEVRRLVSRVSVLSITNDFSLQQHRDAEFRVVAIYLINVAGDLKYLSPENGSLWYSKMKNDASASASALTYSGALNVSVPAGTSYSVPHYFYCYPNSCTDDTSAASWSPRQTRLVVETTLDGKTYYYPVNMENMESNHTYEITGMRITRIGSESPDIPVSSKDVEITVVVKDWEPGTSAEVEI